VAPNTPAASAHMPPAPVPRSGKAWPFHDWDRAEAFVFNDFDARPGVPLRVYDGEGWSPHVSDRKPLSGAQALEAVALVRITEGDAEMSKCPFPRHAVVLYADDVPVASINVCFECTDILVWPPWDDRDTSRLSLEEIERFGKKKRSQHDIAFPRWQRFFRDSLGFAIDRSRE
jgi:hypothetical protein